MVWNETTVKWYKDASDYTGYSAKLAGLLLEKIDARNSLCDLGCGISLVDMELAGEIGSITCIDSDSFAVEETRRIARQKGIENITAMCQNAVSAKGAFDTVMCLFHGNIEQYIDTYSKLAKHRFIAVVHDDPDELVRMNKPRIRQLTSVSQTSQHLKDRGIHHSIQRCTLEFGQPFTSRQQAREYVVHYKKVAEGESAGQCVDRCTVGTEREDFPLYIPHQRRFAIFTIDM